MKARFSLAVLLAVFFVVGCDRGPTISAHNLSDQYWTRGIGNKWAGFFVLYTPELEKELAVGKELVFADGSTRKVIRQEHKDKYLNVYLDGALLDGNAVGHPKTIKVVKP